MNNAVEQKLKSDIESRGEVPARPDSLRFGSSAVRGMVVLVLAASGCTLDAMGECDTANCGSKGDAGADIILGTGGVAGNGGEPEGGAGTAGLSGSGGETGGSAGEAGSAGTGGVDASAGTGGTGGEDAGPDVIEETAEADVEAEAGEDVIEAEAGEAGILCDPADPNSITVVTEDECFKGMQYTSGGTVIVPEGSTPDGVACQTTPYCMKNMQSGSFGFLTVKNTLNGCITVHHAAQLKMPGLYGICVSDYSAAPGPTQAEMKNKFMSGGYNALTANSSDNPVTLCLTCPTGTWTAYRLDVAP